MDLIDINNILLKHKPTFSKMSTIIAVQVFSPELISPVVSFSRIFFYTLGTPIFRKTWGCLGFFGFFTAMRQASFYSLYIFVSSKNRTSCNGFCSEVLGKIVVCQHGVCWLFRTKIFPKCSEYTEAVTVKRCSAKNIVLKNLANFARQHVCWSLFFTKYFSKNLTTSAEQR